MGSAVLWDGKVPIVDLVEIFQPYRKQAEFLLSPDRNRFFCAGRGAGKSWALALDVLFQTLINPGCKGLFLGRTEGDLEQNLLPMFEQHRQTLIEATGYDIVQRIDAGAQTYVFKNGSRFVHRGFENINKVRMFSVTWVAMDEVEHSRVPLKEILRAVKPTIRVPGPRQGMAIASSPNGLSGFTKLFYDHQRKQTPGWYVCRCPSYASPHISQEDLDDWRDSMSEDDWRQEVEAIALRAKELVYHQFQPSRHIRPINGQAILSQPGAHLVIGVDWGLNHAAALAVAVDPAGIWHVIDELTSEPKSRGHWQEDLDKFIKRQGKPPHLIAYDRAVPEEAAPLRNTWGRTHKTMVLPCDSKKDQEIMGGVAKVQAMLSPAGDRQPRLLFSDRLNRMDDRPTATVIPGLEGYRFMKHLDGSLSDKPYKDDRFDHICDTLRMAVVVGWRFPELSGGKLLRNDTPDGWHPDGRSHPERAHF